MKKILSVLILSMSTLVFAESTGVYVGLNAGMGWNDVATPAGVLRLNSGYNFNKFFAIEAGATGVAKDGNSTYDAGQRIYDLSVKGTLPMGDHFDLFAQAGGAYQTTGNPTVPENGIGDITYDVHEATSPAWKAVVGAGFDVNFTKLVALTVTDLYYFGSPNALGDTNILLAGIKFSF
jgi:hypothetical protein